MEKKENSQLHVLVVGNCGAGKSNFINNILNAQIAPVSDDPLGETKTVQRYDTFSVTNQPLVFWDTPGIGSIRVAHHILDKLLVPVLGRIGVVVYVHNGLQKRLEKFSKIVVDSLFKE